MIYVALAIIAVSAALPVGYYFLLKKKMKQQNPAPKREYDLSDYE
ncbi:hypothetical protein [Laceyella putida]|uniref:Uncharacterized protein n=1 Tax=Laceyella putida TaxID=110101 RepID=A0ABW2RPV8_9BACL